MDTASTYDLVSITDNFNKRIKQLITIIQIKLHDNVLVESTKQKINLAIKADPVFILEEGGPYIYKYKDLIYDDHFDNFIMHPYEYIKDDDKKSIENVNTTMESDKKDGFKFILDSLRAEWKNYSEQEKKKIKTIVKVLLSEYCKYIILKEERQIK